MMTTLKISLAVLTMIGLASCMMAARGPGSEAMSEQVPKSEQQPPEGAESVVVAGGCFWCIEAVFDELKGVYWAESGYAGGDNPNPSYQNMGNHAEAVKIVFDPKVVSAEDLLRYFFALHDPTTLNRQGPDVGIQYRSAIFYANEADKAMAERIKKEIADAKLWDNPIVTTIEPLKNYRRAEEYHQDYFVKFEKASPAERMKMNAGYCSAIIEPKVRKFREKFAAKLKKP